MLQQSLIYHSRTLFSTLTVKVCNGHGFKNVLCTWFKSTRKWWIQEFGGPRQRFTHSCYLKYHSKYETYIHRVICISYYLKLLAHTVITTYIWKCCWSQNSSSKCSNFFLPIIKKLLSLCQVLTKQTLRLWHAQGKTLFAVHAASSRRAKRLFLYFNANDNVRYQK